MKRKTKGILLPFFIILSFTFLILFCWCYFCREKRPSTLSESFQRLDQMKSKGAPLFTLPDLFSKEEISLTGFKGKVFLVHFWASWCEPCMKEMPSFLKLSNRFKDSIVVFAISVDKDLEEAKIAMKPFKKLINKSSFKVLWDSNFQVAFNYSGSRISLPETYILDAQRKLIKKIGVQDVQDWDDEETIKFFHSLIQDSPFGLKKVQN